VRILSVEPLQRTVGTTRVLVTVRTFPVLEVECALGEQIQWVLCLGLLWHKVIIFIIVIISNLLRLLLLFLLFWCSWGSRCLLLFWRGPLERLLNILDRTEDSLELGLVRDSLQEAHDVNEFGAHSGVHTNGNGTRENRSNSDVSKGDALADEEGTGAQISVDGGEVVD
jgi:hypothetical protein